MSEPFTRGERDALLERIRSLESELYPPGGSQLNRPERARLRDRYYIQLGEYADRLPRILVSVCPFTAAPLRRAIDPYGLDGPWWHKDRPFKPDEPAAPPTFRVLLGALDLRGRVPSEAREIVLAGPDAPFVVPRLLALPDMVAVIHRIELATGDIAYPVAYFSRETTDPEDLHQHWTRPELWFKDEKGDEYWLIKNDPWDFDLAPWIERGKLKWVEDAGAKPVAVGHESGRRCPYLGLPGDHLPQEISGGERLLGEAPSGEPIEPFELD